jgi:hypothetical protein
VSNTDRLGYFFGVLFALVLVIAAVMTGGSLYEHDEPQHRQIQPFDEPKTYYDV